MRLTPLLHLLLLLPLGAVVACTAKDSPSSGDESDLIGGRNARADELGSTMLIKGNCTVSRVGPRHVLTAAHCVTGIAGSAFTPGATIEITTSKGVGGFAEDGGTDASAPAGPWRSVTIEKTEVHPAWRDKCASVSCGGVHIAGRNEMADLAVIVTREDLPADIPEAAIDLSPVAPGDRVVVTGFGCEDAVGGSWDYSNQRLKVAETEAVAFERTIHPGSFIYPEDRDTPLASTMDGIYVITPGPTDLPPVAPSDAAEAGAPDAGGADASAPADPRGGLCPGDSGGPLYRLGERAVIVGVNANYTFATGESYPLGDATSRTFQYGGSPVTNWHTRLDNQRGLQTGTWLKEIGARTVCSRGGCE